MPAPEAEDPAGPVLLHSAPALCCLTVTGLIVACQAIRSHHQTAEAGFLGLSLLRPPTSCTGTVSQALAACVADVCEGQPHVTSRLLSDNSHMLIMIWLGVTLSGMSL